MSSDLMIFNNVDFGEVRILNVEGEPWFVGKDIAWVLGYANPSKAVSTHVDEKDKILEMITHLKEGKIVRTQTALINERGVHSLLAKSKVATSNYKERFKEWLVQTQLIEDKYIVNSRKEVNFIDNLINSLSVFNIDLFEKQHKIKDEKGGEYRIDLYIPSLNIAIEYDENNHKYYTYEQQESRQREIEEKLGCKFIRVSDKNSDEFNIGYIIKEIFELEVV